MASRLKLDKNTRQERQNRYFSDDFKKKKVGEIDRNIVTVTEVCREYQVSYSAVYKWIYKFSKMRKKQIKQVVESKSDTIKIALLKQKIKDLEQSVGQKQIQVDFLSKVIDLAEEEYGIDIKKKSNSKPSNGSGITKKSTSTK